MAGNFNRVFLMGNLTRDPEIRYTGNNMAIAKLGLAVNRRYRTADGQVKEETTFVDCDAFGKTAETIGKFLTKGRPIFIEGHLRLDTWRVTLSGILKLTRALPPASVSISGLKTASAVIFLRSKDSGVSVKANESAGSFASAIRPDTILEFATSNSRPRSRRPVCCCIK